MKNNILCCLATIIAAFASIACSKSDNPEETEAVKEKKVAINIRGSFASLDTKATIENVFRMKWSGNEQVYVFGTTNGTTITLLGTLTATVVEDTENRVADLSGTITEPHSGTFITLLYSPELESAPSIDEQGAVNIPISEQKGKPNEVTFIAYSSIEYSGAVETIRTSFSFATSVLRANITGLDISASVSKIMLSNVESTCRLEISALWEPTISGTTTGTITKNLTGASSNASGNFACYIAVPAISANDNRYLSLLQGDNGYYCTDFATGAKQENSLMNSIGNTIKESYPGARSEEPVTIGSTTWAPVNCGADAGNPNGLMYQWGRRWGHAYNASPSFITTQALDMDAGNTDETKDYFYSISPCWYSGNKSNDTWIYDPCPTGWRLPTVDELGALFYPDWISFSDHGLKVRGAWDNTNKGWDFGALFFPAAGYRSDEGISKKVNEVGCYWGDTSSSIDWSYFMHLRGSGSTGIGTNYRSNSFSVRCVKKTE